MAFLPHGYQLYQRLLLQVAPTTYDFRLQQEIKIASPWWWRTMHAVYAFFMTTAQRYAIMKDNVVTPGRSLHRNDSKRYCKVSLPRLATLNYFTSSEQLYHSLASHLGMILVRLPNQYLKEILAGILCRQGL